jgi:fatty acid desaturase
MFAQKKTIPLTSNVLFSASITAVVLLEMFWLPSVSLSHPVLATMVALLLIPLNLPFWSLIHEAIHKNLLPGREVNEAAGRFMSVLFGIPYQVLRFGHLMHHQYNREWEAELYDDNQSGIVAHLTHFSKMLGGLYLSEVAAAFALAQLPLKISKRVMKLVFADGRHYEAALNALLKKESVEKIRIDSFIIMLLYGLFFVASGSWTLPLVIILGRAFAVSLMDNAYHYGTPLDNSVPAKELRASMIFERFILNFNHHLTHHRNPALPWNQLPAQRIKNGGSYTEDLIGAVLAQFRGPIKVAQRRANTAAAVA